FEEPLVGGKAVAQHDEGLRLDQPVGVLFADHGGFEHGLVRGERRLDFERRHPHAADLEHVVGAAAVVIVALAVAAIFIAGEGPFAGKSASAFGPLIPVTFGGGGAAHHKFADVLIGNVAALVVHDFQLVAGDRFAGGAVLHIAGAVRQKRLEHFGRANAV